VGDSSCIIVTWDGWVHIGLGGTGGMSSKDGGFNGNGRFPISSGGVALGNMGGGLAAGTIVIGRGSDGEEKNGGCKVCTCCGLGIGHF